MKNYDESQNMSNEEMLEELAEYDAEWTTEKQEELSDLEEAIEQDKEFGERHKDEFEKDKWRARREISEKWFERNLDILRGQGNESLADQFNERMEKIDENSKKEWGKRKAAEEKGEPYIGPDKSFSRQKEELERQVGDAIFGITPDVKSEILEDYDEIIEHHEGKPYLDERREQILDKHSYEENEENIDEAYREGKFDQDERNSWKMRNRRHYGK